MAHSQQMMRSLVMEIGLTTILVSVIPRTATGSRGIGHDDAIAVVLIVLVRGMPPPAEREAAEGGDVHVRTGDDGSRRLALRDRSGRTRRGNI